MFAKLDHLSSKVPEDVDGKIKRSDKTIVISRDMHDKLLTLKKDYMKKTGRD